MVSHATHCNLAHNPARTQANCPLRDATSNAHAGAASFPGPGALAHALIQDFRKQQAPKQSEANPLLPGCAQTKQQRFNFLRPDGAEEMPLLKGVNGRDAASTEADINLAERGPYLIISAF